MYHKKQSRKIIELYESYGVPLKLPKCEIIANGEVYIYDVKFRPGTKESKIFDHASDIQLAMKLPLFQPFREDLSLRIAISERPVIENSLSKMLASPLLCKSNLWLPIPLGYDMRRKMHFADLAKFPHALLGGATNSGKTVGLRCLITSLIATQPVKVTPPQFTSCFFPYNREGILNLVNCELCCNFTHIIVTDEIDIDSNQTPLCGAI